MARRKNGGVEWSRDDDYFIYTNTKTGEAVRVWAGDILGVAFLARDWHSGQGSALYRLGGGNDFSLETLKGSARELGHGLRNFTMSRSDRTTGASALDELKHAIGKIEAIAGDDD
jgi:hypothetical protein